MRPFALLLCVGLVTASSFPDVTSCVAEDEAGLAKAMFWVKSAVRTDAYTLRTGDGCDRSRDPTSYIPGQFTSIHLRTHKYKGQFRGLLIYATDASQNRVGDWQLDWPNSNMFWKPQGLCKNVSLMHLNGAEKFYHHEFKFIAPPVGTGTIEFHTLIKRGEANTGEFYYANLDKNLMLAEGSVNAASVWVEGAPGATCADTCASVSKTCDSVLYNNAFKWSTALHTDVLLSVGCASPGLASKDAKMISKDAGWCTYPSFDAQAVEGACATAPPVTTDGIATNPICPCGSAGQPSFGINVPLPATACLNEFVVMGSAPKSTSTAVSFLLILLTGAFLNQSKHANLMLTFFCVLFCAYTVQAHNWVFSVSRSFNQASTYKPCRPKVSDVPHWQINQGQEFWMEWATGHDHYFYFTVVRAEDILALEKTTQNHLDNYIKACENRSSDDYMRGKTTSTGTPPGKHWAKQHINREPDKKKFLSSDSPPTEIFARNISAGDPLFFERHAKFGTNTRDLRWVYNDAFTSKDRRCSYYNPNYPHIVAVHRFTQVETTVSRAGDRDTARFTIELPDGYPHGTGQYIMQYLWRGYFDCADIDLFPDSTPVSPLAVGGRPLRPDEPQWNKVDHCLFEEIQNVETPCTEVVTHASRCLSACVARADCGGVNVVPMWLPKTVYPLFSDRVGIPFDDMSGRCPRARFAGLNRDGRVCYGVLPRLPNNTHAMYSVTDDPEDPLFYSTCFVKRSQWAFDLSLGNSTGSAPAPIPPAWAFGDKCVDCMEWKASQENFNVPTWKLPETCVNCELAAEAGLLPPVPELPGKIISRGYKCDGFYESKTIWRYQQKTSECSTVKCIKTLSMAGATAIEADECLAKARADPQCSDVVMHRGNGQNRACECYIKAEVEPCCGTCVPVDADFQTSRAGKLSEWNIYSVAPPKPDPACERGVKSADGAYCCSASCEDANGVGMCMPKPALQVSFQDYSLVAPDGWGVDNGFLFGARTTPGYSSNLSTTWGWNCLSNIAAVNYRDRDTEDGTNFHGTTVRPGSSECLSPEWSVEVPPGDYHVDTLYSDPNQNLRGCKIQGVNNFEPTKVSLGSSDMAWVSRVVTVNATGKISLTGGSTTNCGGYSAVVIYPKNLVPSNTSCQALPGMCCPLFVDMEHRSCKDYEAPCKL